jgi:glycosyltransferase involved in cell wall biosynthesis
VKFVVEAVGLTAGGGKTGLLRLVPALASYREHDFVFLVPRFPEFLGTSGPNVKLFFRPKPGSLVARRHFLQQIVPEICREERPDALLALGNLAPRRSPVPVVLVVQNAFYAYREPVAERKMTLREKFIIGYGRAQLRRMASNIHLVVQTHLMKSKMVSVYQLDPGRVRVIPERDGFPSAWDGTHGVPGRDAADSARHAAEESRKTASGERPIPFNFLCLAVYYPHKNLEVLVEAMKILPRYSSHPAVCRISIDPDQHPGARKLLKTVARENLQDIIRNIGPVPEYLVGEAYRIAQALIQPTLLETFGRTYIEAMHYGLPILTSDREFARFVCQDAAIYFDPLDADSVAKTMARVIEDHNLRLRLVRNGQRLVSRLPSWEDIAARYVETLEAAAGAPRCPN